jgi:hypothetical protein
MHTGRMRAYCDIDRSANALYVVVVGVVSILSYSRMRDCVPDHYHHTSVFVFLCVCVCVREE